MFGKRNKPRIIFVTGKGGVGKSLTAAAIAWREASHGHKVLLAELGEKSFYEKLLELEPIEGEVEFEPNLWLTRWEAEACLREYVRHYMVIPRAVDLFMDNQVIKALVRAAPALKELSLLGKVTSSHRHTWATMDYDVVVVDAYSSGHFMALIRAPMGMLEAIPVGPTGRQCRNIINILQNPDVTRFVVVALAEELPVTESLELRELIVETLGREPEMLCNRIIPEDYSREVARLLETPEDPSRGFLEYLDQAYRRQRKYLRKLRKAETNASELPFVFSAAPLDLIEGLAAELPG